MSTGNGLRSEDEVRASLDRSTRDLRSALERIELGAREKLDVGRKIAKKGPEIFVVGFVVGAVLGMIMTRPRPRYYREY